MGIRERFEAIVSVLPGVESLPKGTVVNSRNRDGATPLIVATEKGETKLAKLLLAKRADINAKNDGGQTALHVAVIVGHEDVVELLLAKNAEVDSRTRTSSTPLHFAAARGRERSVELLLARKADVNAATDEGDTPLHGAAKAGHLKVAEMLLAKRADVGARNNNDVTPLYLASYGDNAEIVKLLLAAGANVNAKSLGGWTPLHAAAEKDRGEIAEILLANHAEIGAQIDGGNTPLNIGVANGSKAVVKLLLARGADVNVSAIGDHGWTVLQLAVRDGHLDLVELLIANHADVNAENEYGWTPLHYAAEKGNLRIAQLLIANGADVSASSAVPNWNDNKSQEWKRQARKNGKKPLYFATCGGHKDVAELFRQPHRISEKEDVKGAYSLGGPGPNGGIVFDLDDSGLHGLEANREDSHNAIREGGVMWCDAVDALARTGGGRLPTVQELQLLFSRKGLVGGFENGHYWTSERCPGSEYLGWAVVFPWGNESKLRAYHDSRRGIDAAYVRGIHNFERSATTLEPSSEHEIDQIPATLGLPKMANPGLVQKLTRSDLPEMIYIPAITIGSMGYSYAQYPDDEGRTHVPVFASEPRATQWLALGKELWIERRDPREGFTTRQFHIRREESTVFDSGLYKRYLLDFEPAPGDLFAPKERTIEILIAENIQ